MPQPKLVDMKIIVNNISFESTCFGRAGRVSKLEARVNTVTMESKIRDAMEAPPDTFAGTMDQLRRWDSYFSSWSENLERTAHLV